jgi:hypothetical protein
VPEEPKNCCGGPHEAPARRSPQRPRQRPRSRPYSGPTDVDFAYKSTLTAYQYELPSEIPAHCAPLAGGAGSAAALKHSFAERYAGVSRRDRAGRQTAFGRAGQLLDHERNGPHLGGGSAISGDDEVADPDSLYKSLRGTREFEDVLLKTHEATRPISISHEAFRIAEGDLVPESEAYDSE